MVIFLLAKEILDALPLGLVFLVIIGALVAQAAGIPVFDTVWTFIEDWLLSWLIDWLVGIGGGLI